MTKHTDKTLKEMKDKGMITEVSFSWCAEDVLGDYPDLTAQQVEDVLGLMKRKHDCTIGMNWEVMGYIVDLILDEMEEQNA